jgi:AcrR family transcriptional regulator
VTSSWDDTLDVHRIQQRDAIFRATVELVAEHGMAGVAMADVARRAGISRATLYKYFPGVEEILAGRMIQEVTREHRLLEHRLELVEPPLDRLHLVLEHRLAYFATPDHRADSAVVDPGRFSPAVAAEVRAAMDRLHEMVRELLTEAIASGALRADADPDFLAEVFHHLLTAGREMVVRGDRTADAMSDAVMDQFVRGAGGAGRPDCSDGT